MPFKSLYLGNIVLFLLLKLFNHKCRATHIFLLVKHLLVQLVMLISQLFKGLAMSFTLSAHISVVLKHILLLHFESSYLLMSKSLLVLQLFDLFLQELVGLSCLGEFIVDKLVFSCKRLDVFSQLNCLSLLHRYYLCLVFHLLSQILVFGSKEFNLVLSFEETALEVIFFVRNASYLVLHVAELKNLLFKFLSAECQVFSLLV